MKRTVEINDDLDERLESCKSELLNDFINYLDDNPDIDDFDTYYQNQGCDAGHDIADSNTPTYNSDIEGLYYLYGDEFDEAFDNAGCYGKGDKPDNYRQVAIYFYLSEKTFDFMNELEEWFNDNYKDFPWKNNKIRRSGLIKQLKEEFK